ncbi:alginate export family protein [Muricauda sp. SCSIO 64092]|uniref:alginate export family protein n=1 Tax=Allomuricauda sp. SCSIO 64092 TaxID=2908842 RepID=UPI001FF4FF6F|nr:alginate export family protein [Muricauda sp. SCSIO 64092]UOY08937.1 alginate export family protein [Muricauda sp. SCSIO 64092]
MKKQFLILGLVFLLAQSLKAQFTLDAQFRPRSEYRNGFQFLQQEGVDAGFVTNTRARLGAKYKTPSYEIYINIQDVQIWGENPQILPIDANNSFALFEAWGELQLGKGWSTKLGRQVLSYDDQRYFGGLDWAQQGRYHDLAMIKYRQEGFMLDLGVAFNQDLDNQGGPLFGFKNAGTEFNSGNPFQYKTMQHLYAKKAFGEFSASLLLVNLGFQQIDATTGDVSDIRSTFTAGTHLAYKKGKFGLEGNAFLQTGEFLTGIDIDGAYLLGLEASYKISPKTTLGIGVETISGDDTSTADATEAFLPHFGTNHKFNGFMDHFYVGNWVNRVGLLDIHASAVFNLGPKTTLFAKFLNFSGMEDTPNGESNLGNELDLVLTQKFNGFALKLGYSQLFAADGLEELETQRLGAAAPVDFKGSQNWAWAMLIIKPTLFTTAKKDQ